MKQKCNKVSSSKYLLFRDCIDWSDPSVALCGNSCGSVPAVQNPPPRGMNWLVFMGDQGLLTTFKELMLPNPSTDTLVNV